ncbi:SigE family RNA polymerase sigma factor [Nonomuraea salmonea]|uniref:SigE family RNA polymerase sigma factor n=1 Tax=Nonomuraea salmonea TaxID=46181 RepID=A0ABV5NCH6_9ACTN
MEHDFGAFVAARGTSLLRVAYLACGDASEAEDVLQTALERTYRNWDRVRHDSPEPYVRRTIINLSISRARRRAILSFIPVHTPPERAARTTDADLRHVLMEALRKLPPRQRAVVVLRYWEDLSEQQAAEVGLLDGDGEEPGVEGDGEAACGVRRRGRGGSDQQCPRLRTSCAGSWPRRPRTCTRRPTCWTGWSPAPGAGAGGSRRPLRPCRWR